jgi:hypothetical protein
MNEDDEDDEETHAVGYWFIGMFIAAVLVLALVEKCSAAEDGWTATDTAAQVAVTALLYEDFRQTHFIAVHPDEYHETNVVLGPHPTQAAVRNYFLGVAAGSAVLSSVLPSEYRHVLQASEAAIEIVAVGHNRRIGITTRF